MIESRVAALLLLGIMPAPTHTPLCCMASVMKYCRVLSLSPFIDALLVKPANSLSFHCWVNQALLLASANFLNCQLAMPM